MVGDKVIIQNSIGILTIIRLYFFGPGNRPFHGLSRRRYEGVAFDAKANDMIEVTHLKNEPWDRTLKEKGEFQKIDYLLAIDSEIASLSYNEAKERMKERSEMIKIFGAA